jgi:hypothetical protein
MPIDSMLVSAAIISMFVVFAGVLAWGDLQTRPKPEAKLSLRKRRTF